MAKTIELSLPTPEHLDLQRGSIFFVGTATVILRYAGFTILTDPNFLHAGNHVHLGYGLTAKRLTNPALEIEELPFLDFCVLSHYHGDHFDQVVEDRLQKDLPIITTPEAAEKISAKGFTKAIALETWDSVVVDKTSSRVSVTSLPGKHGPALADLILPEVMGSMLQFESANRTKLLNLYISGDTLVFDHLREIPQRYPSIDLGLFHLGGTRVMGILVTMDAEQGVDAVRIINPREVIPIHYNDYDVFKSPLEDFKKAIDEAGLGHRVTYLSHGETYNFEVPGERLQAA